MDPIISCKNFELTDAISKSVEEQSKKVAKRAEGQPLSVNMEKIKGGLYRVHLEFLSKSVGALNATAQGKDLYSNIRSAGEKLIRQVNDSKDRVEGKHARDNLSHHLDDEPLEEPNGTFQA